MVSTWYQSKTQQPCLRDGSMLQHTRLSQLSEAPAMSENQNSQDPPILHRLSTHSPSPCSQKLNRRRNPPDKSPVCCSFSILSFRGQHQPTLPIRPLTMSPRSQPLCPNPSLCSMKIVNMIRIKNKGSKFNPTIDRGHFLGQL